MKSSPVASASVSPPSSSSSDSFVCQWKNCSLLVHSTEEMKDHIEQEHLGTKKGSYRCDWAGCNFGERRKIYDLKTHVTLHHQHLSYFCQTCNKGFLRDQELRKHHKVGCQKVDSTPANSVQFSPLLDNINHAPSPVSSEGYLEVPYREGSSEWSDAYDEPLSMSDHSSPAEVPVYSDSKKRQRGEVVEQFFDSFKREKIDPTPTRETLTFLVSANEIMDQDPDFLSNFDLNESFDFLQALKKNIESMPASQLNSLLDDVYFGPMGEELDSEGLEFTKEISEESSLSPILNAIEPPHVQTTEEQIALLDSLQSEHRLDYYGERDQEEEEEDMQVPTLAEQEDSSIFSILSTSSFSNSGSPPKNLHAVPPIISRPAPVPSFSASSSLSSSSSSSSSSAAAPSLASSVVFPASAKVSGGQLSESLKSKGVSTRSATKKSNAQMPQVPQVPEALRSPRASSMPAPPKQTYFAVPPALVSPGEFTEKKRHKDTAAGSSFVPLFMGNLASTTAHLTQTGPPGSSQQVRHATTVAPLAATISLYDRYAEKDSEEKSKKKTLSPLVGPTRRRTSAAEVGDMTDLLQTLDFQEKEKEDNTIPPKPSMPSHLQIKKGPEGLLATPSSPPVQTAMRFSKQEVLGMIERLLKRV